MEPTDLTIHILTEIRDEIRSTNERLDGVKNDLGARIDKTNDRVELLNTELGGRIDETNRRLTESEIRTTTALIDVVASVHEVRDLLIERRDLRVRVERCEQDIDDLKRRVY